MSNKPSQTVKTEAEEIAALEHIIRNEFKRASQEWCKEAAIKALHNIQCTGENEMVVIDRLFRS
jgi:hypothetical protein